MIANAASKPVGAADQPTFTVFLALGRVEVIVVVGQIALDNVLLDILSR